MPINNLRLCEAAYQGTERVGKEKIVIQQDHIDIDVKEAKGDGPPVECIKC
jgi:hypothetical protein